MKLLAVLSSAAFILVDGVMAAKFCREPVMGAVVSVAVLGGLLLWLLLQTEQERQKPETLVKLFRLSLIGSIAMVVIFPLLAELFHL